MKYLFRAIWALVSILFNLQLICGYALYVFVIYPAWNFRLHKRNEGYKTNWVFLLETLPRETWEVFNGTYVDPYEETNAFDMLSKKNQEKLVRMLEREAKDNA